ncbi:RidA family protein [Runella sp. CRIBMP]|uniref:RidA family protein n=1 Tax=Runella sp. CRIBMP TaxID=2683261 RepID=UPI0014136294|nr:RidA family protein [Runella sp. CRIBMP]NBB20090.1 RidA family protein [Runella sp. CRIBMP]
MPQSRTNISSGSPWEATVGYSRAVKIGAVIEISGTVAVEDGQVVGLEDPYVQTKVILKKIEAVLAEAGASLKDVVRTRIFVTDISQWEAVGRAHGEFFGEIRPCTTMVEVSRLIAPEYMVEIETTAILEN